jgi:hypothetical protein
MVERKRRTPDKRIIITETIVIIEYSNGCDLVVKRSDNRAEAILQMIKL